MINSIAKWFQETVLGRDLSSTEIVDYPWNDPTFWNKASDVYIREIAFFSAVNMVANAVSKCEFKTFLHGKEVKDREYYLWNIEPNMNQGASEFVQKWITQLYLHNEALVVEVDGQLLVADSYQHKTYALYEDVFSGVTIDDFTFNRSFVQSEVLYFRLSSCDMRTVTNGLFAAYQKLIDYSVGSYAKSRGRHGVLKTNAMFNGDIKKEQSYNQYIKQQFKEFYESENSVLPLQDKYEYAELESKTYSNEGTRDIRAMIDDVMDFTARAFSIPPALLNGKVEGTEQAIDNFLTFCIDPLCDMIQEEITRKRYGVNGFLAGSYLKVDTRNIKHVDLLDVATSVDKLISSGVFSVNDIRQLIGDTAIDEDWAGVHFMTKNYSTVGDLMNALGTTESAGSEDPGESENETENET